MENNKLVTLKLIGFDQVKRNNLAAILTLAARLLDKKWRIVNTDQADFFLFSVEASLADKQQLLPPERCLFCVTQAEFHENANMLLVDDKHLPRLSVLVKLFNQVLQNPEAAPEIGSTEAEIAKLEEESALFTAELLHNTAAEAFFDAERGLLGHLLTIDDGRLMIRLTGQVNYPALYIDVESNAYYSQHALPQLSPYLTEPENLTFTSFSKLELKNALSQENLKPQSLKELIWYIVMQTSEGKILKNHVNTDIVHLKNWPDLRLFKCIEYAKVATFMKHNAACLKMIAEQTQMPIEEIYTFYNACYLLGLIEKRNQVEITKKVLSAERLSLLNKIDARLK